MMGYGYNGITGGWIGMLIPLILIVVIVYAVIKLAGNNNTRNGRESDNALDILNERFAKGEINEEEYNQKKALLRR